jgi:hypothetical protein
MTLFPPNNSNNNSEFNKEFKKDEYITLSLESLDILWDKSHKYSTFLTEIYRIDAELKKLGHNKNKEHLWSAIEEFINAYGNILPDSVPLMNCLTALKGDMSNLRSGVHSQLFALGSAKRGDSPRSPRKLAWKAQAASFLRLFMDRDGPGAQKAAAEKIAQALGAGGVFTPGPDKKTYSGHAIIKWMRKAQVEKTAFAKDYQNFVSNAQRRAASEPGRLERDLEGFTDLLKSQVFEPRRAEAARSRRKKLSP